MLSKDQLCVGDKVKFTHRGKEMIATITRLNTKSASIDANGITGRVDYYFLTKANENTIATSAPEKQLPAPRKSKGLSPGEVSVGDKVKFWYRGEELIVTVTRVNEKTVSISGGSFKGRVSYKVISKVDGGGAVVSTVLPKKKEREWAPDQKRDYEFSQKLTIDPLPDAVAKRIHVKVMKLDLAFSRDDKGSINVMANEISDLLCDHYNVSRVKVWTDGKIQPTMRGTRHGVHRTRDMSTDSMRGSISVFSRAENGNDLVKSSDFVKTLVHEWMHHWDRFAHKIIHEYHTSGFHKRVDTIHDQIKMA